MKGALFARYSRYPGSLRRLFLDEFAAEVPEGGRPFDGVEGERAAGLYERVFIGYGDDSIAQVGGAHLACEWVSNILTKVLQRGRLAAYLEQSTRYIPYDQPMRRAAATATTATTSSGPPTRRRWTSCSAIYSRSLESVQAWAAERWPRGDEPERAWRRSIRAKSLDLLRGLLPASTLSHVGIFASGQAYEQLLLRLMASPLPEAREYGEHDPRPSSSKVIPSFVARVERPDRGGEWIDYLRQRREATERAVARLGLDRRDADRRALGRAGPRRGRRGGPAGGLAVRVGGRLRGRDPRQDRGPRPDRARRADRASWPASGETAATAPAAAGRRCATGSRSSPTTAASATSSAIGC